LSRDAVQYIETFERMMDCADEAEVEAMRASLPKDLLFGMIKATVTPPKDLYHPVLPQKRDGKLMFTLERQTGTWTTHELYKAIQKGYRVERIYEAWHFPTVSTDLFRDYIQVFYRLKDEAKQNGNAALKSVMKLCLNSLWGRFSMRNDMGESKVLKTKGEIDKVVFDSAIEVTSMKLVNEDEGTYHVSYKTAKAAVKPHATTNVYIAAFVTSFARQPSPHRQPPPRPPRTIARAASRPGGGCPHQPPYARRAPSKRSGQEAPAATDASTPPQQRRGEQAWSSEAGGRHAPATRNVNEPRIHFRRDHRRG
jgi:hypothetical protein